MLLSKQEGELVFRISQPFSVVSVNELLASTACVLHDTKKNAIDEKL